MVYVCIKAADNRGIWTKDLKVKTNLHQTVLNKVLKSLETGKRLIKAVRNVKNPTRKVYMLVGLTPSAEVTGGPWFSESELDVEFINELCRVCLRFIESRSPAPDSDSDGIVSVSTLLSRCPSLTDVHEFISSSGITSTELGIEDVRMLLNRLIYDGEVERVVRAVQHAVADSAEADENDDLFVYRALKMHGTEDAAEAVLSALSTVPCAACPVFDLCSEGAPISPSSCEYYKKWLSGFQ
jgi:DNA-directed RNA polymerase III subunit RPC6